MKLLNEIWEDIRNGQYLEIYILIAAAAIIAILGLFGVITNQAFILSIILATLAPILFRLLRNHKKDEEIQRALENFVEVESEVKQALESLQNQKECRADQFFNQKVDLKKYEDRIGNSKEIFLWGLALSTSVLNLENAIREGLRNGAKMRFVLAKPDSAATEMSAFATKHLQDKNTENKMIDITLSRLSHLSSIASQANWQGRIEVKLVESLNPWTVIAIDPHENSGTMTINISTFRAQHGRRPSFELAKKQDASWFDFFSDQLDELWEAAGDTITLNEGKIVQ